MRVSPPAACFGFRFSQSGLYFLIFPANYKSIFEIYAILKPVLPCLVVVFPSLLCFGFVDSVIDIDGPYPQMFSCSLVIPARSLERVF